MNEPSGLKSSRAEETRKTRSYVRWLAIALATLATGGGSALVVHKYLPGLAGTIDTGVKFAGILISLAIVPMWLRFFARSLGSSSGERAGLFWLAMVTPPRMRDAVIGDAIERRAADEVQFGPAYARILFWRDIVFTTVIFFWSIIEAPARRVLASLFQVSKLP